MGRGSHLSTAGVEHIALKVIDFISQFEDELVRIWNKPKFFHGSHYIVTLDRLAAEKGGLDIIAELLKGMNVQIAEWHELGIVEEDFDASLVLDGGGKDSKLADAWRSLPIDTIHFKSMEPHILGRFKSQPAHQIKQELLSFLLPQPLAYRTVHKTCDLLSEATKLQEPPTATISSSQSRLIFRNAPLTMPNRFFLFFVGP